MEVSPLPAFRSMTRWMLLCLCLAVIITVACSENVRFRGTELTAGEPAAEFDLVDERGRAAALADYHGRVLLLTFLYTNCPDVCPAITADLRETHELLGDDAGDVSIVAISVDPARDTVESARQSSDRWDMTDRWDFLLGDEEELSRLWAAYYISATVDDEPSGGEESDENRGSSGGALDSLTQDSFLVTHSAPVYIIDADGIRRVLFTPPFDPDDLAHDVRLLLQ